MTPQSIYLQLAFPEDPSCSARSAIMACLRLTDLSLLTVMSQSSCDVSKVVADYQPFTCLFDHTSAQHQVVARLAYLFTKLSVCHNAGSCLLTGNIAFTNEEPHCGRKKENNIDVTSFLIPHHGSSTCLASHHWHASTNSLFTCRCSLDTCYRR
jgi:hypothetical protein